MRLRDSRALRLAIVIGVPAVSGIAWIAAGGVTTGLVSIAVALVNALVTRAFAGPLRIPSLVPPSRRKPFVIPQLRWPGRG